MKLWAVLGILLALSAMGGGVFYLIDSRAVAIAEADQAKADYKQLKLDGKAIRRVNALFKRDAAELVALKRKFRNAKDETGCYRVTPIPADVVTGVRKYHAKIFPP